MRQLSLQEVSHIAGAAVGTTVSNLTDYDLLDWAATVGGAYLGYQAAVTLIGKTKAGAYNYSVGSLPVGAAAASLVLGMAGAAVGLAGSKVFTNKVLEPIENF